MTAMPIIPPSWPLKNWGRAVVEAVTDAPVAIAAGLASAVPPQPPMPEPLNFAGIVHDTTEGLIETITDPSTMSALQQQRNKIISGTYGRKSMMIVEAAVAKQCRPGQHMSRLLDVLEAIQRRGYEILLENQRVRF
jgi:hypothetical protein